MDDFGVLYVGREHAEHLIDSMKKCHEGVIMDWKGEQLLNELELGL